MLHTILLIFVILAAFLIAVAIWVRVAPSDAARWHQMPDQIDNADQTGSAMRVVENADMASLDKIIRATPRTEVLAGSVAEGMVTYITRSALFGFPDYTTVRQREGRIEIFGRLRFGKSDLGVNAKRIDGWLAALGQG